MNALIALILYIIGAIIFGIWTCLLIIEDKTDRFNKYPKFELYIVLLVCFGAWPCFVIITLIDKIRKTKKEHLATGALIYIFERGFENGIRRVD